MEIVMDMIDITKERGLDLSKLDKINKNQIVMRWIDHLPSTPILDSDDIATVQEYQAGSWRVSISFLTVICNSYRFYF